MPAQTDNVAERRREGSLNTTPSRTALLTLVIVVSLIARVAHLVSAYRTPSFSYHQTWPNADMYLTNQWAQRIIDGDILGRKIYHPLTDWMRQAAPAAQWAAWFGDRPVYLKGPVYTYLVALLRWLFGDAMLALAILQILASTLAVTLLFMITEHLFGSTAGFLAGLLLAVYAPAIHYDVVMLRGPWIILAALLITWRLLKLRQAPTPRAAAILGMILGGALLLNEGFAPLPALVLAVILCWVPKLHRFAILSAALVAGLAVTLSPLILRNWMVGVPPLQFAVSGAYAYTVWNAVDSDPVFFRGPSPSFLPLMETNGGRLANAVWGCLRSFPSVGAFLGFYLHRAAGLVVPFENPDNASFYYAALTDPLLPLLPTYAVVCPLIAIGLCLGARHWRDLSILLPGTLAFFLSIMLTQPLSRYRLQLVVLLLPLAGFALAETFRWISARNLAPLALAASTMVLVSFAARFLERSVVFSDRDPSSVMYRPVEFNLASEAYAKQGRYREATRELLDLAELCHVPAEQAGAKIRAARLQIQAGNPAAAGPLLQSASELDSSNPAVLLVIGDTFWQMLGDAERAGVAYRRVSGLAPSGPFAEVARQRLRTLGLAVRNPSSPEKIGHSGP